MINMHIIEQFCARMNLDETMKTLMYSNVVLSNNKLYNVYFFHIFLILITYIVCWYTSLNQVNNVMETRITTSCHIDRL